MLGCSALRCRSEAAAASGGIPVTWILWRMPSWEGQDVLAKALVGAVRVGVQ
jgi:predicted CxxxxCH...CXXCH cytochrome family protein